ncbi:MAG: hypothetical protein ABSA94_12795, partial [Acidobacteriaceae bacterium]
SSDLLQEVLNDAIDLLNKEGIYSVLSYGWEDENTPSPEYVGIAMWITDSPFELEFAFWDRSSPPPLPTSRDEVFYKAGEDFLGTMDLARNALALTRYCYEHRKPAPILDDEELFWEYRAAASLWMNISSDRLLEYFVMARFGIATKKLIATQEFKKFDRKSGILARVFGLPGNGEGPLAIDAGKGLVELAEPMDALRRTRNEIVHEIASRCGSNALKLLNHQREEAAKSPYVPRRFDMSKEGLASLADTSKLLADGKQAELLDVLSKLKEWYCLLVKAASLVFEFEYWKRTGR